MKNEVDLKNIIKEIDDKEIKKFLYDNLNDDEKLLNRFRVEFSKFFPTLSKKEYENRVNRAIYNCSDDRNGFISYRSTGKYERAMIEFVNEARNLVVNEDYKTAFTLVTVLLDSIPETPIDDSDGSTGMVSEDCIEIINDILNNIDNTDELVKEILDYILKDIKELNLQNYGIEIDNILIYFISNKLYLDEIEESLLIGLDKSKEQDHCYYRKDYINYLIDIYTLNDKKNIMGILEKYSGDRDICMMYVDELIKDGKLDNAIKILKSNLVEKNYSSSNYALKLAQIYNEYNMKEDYKNILYDIFYKYSRYDIGIYFKIKDLYTDKEWNQKKYNIINKLKGNSGTFMILNKLYVEEKMYDELYLNICKQGMENIICYEEYLLPKYRNELINIYKESCLNDACYAKDRNSYRSVAHKVNSLIRISDSDDDVKFVLKEINENYFRNRPAMLDEFKKSIKNLDEYLK